MMMQLATEETTYASAFRRHLETQPGEPSWLRSLRERAFERFEHLGFPTVDDEDWKYTNVAAIAKTSFTPARANFETVPTRDEVAPHVFDEAKQSCLVFVNGILNHELSSFAGLPGPPIDLTEGRRNDNEQALRKLLAVDPNHNGFIALNTAFFSNATCLRIPAGTKIETPILLLFVSGGPGAGAPLASFPRVLIVAEQGSEATLIESYVNVGGESYLNDAVMEIVVEDSARLQHFRIQRESTAAFHIAFTRAQLGKNANYYTTAINLGAALSRHDIDVVMDAEGAECSVDGLYMVDGRQHTDTHSVIDHQQPRCTSHQLYKGILDGNSRAVFNGKVFVRHGAQQTDARQTNKNLLLSNEARVDTKPQLEIFADDVKCAHGAAIGRLDEDEVFYLESRGINPTLARNILTYGFAEEVIEKIEIDSLKRQLDESVLHRLHSQLAIE